MSSILSTANINPTPSSGNPMTVKIMEIITKPAIGIPADPIVLNQDSSELRLLVNIRDEAHRFALAYHKKLRKKQYYKSPLDKITGIGQIKKKNLLKHFGDMQKIRNASLDDLGKVKSISAKDAMTI